MEPNRIGADDLTAGVKVQHARHVLIVSDSCYPGDLFAQQRYDCIQNSNHDGGDFVFNRIDTPAR